MVETNSRQNTPIPMSAAGVTVRLIIAWIWVGVPLALGVYRTILDALPLFQS